MHLGWQRWKDDNEGRWVLRRYIGNNKYRTTALGRADDAPRPDGEHVLNFEQAEAKARAMVDAPNGQSASPHRTPSDGALHRVQALAQGAARS